VSVCVSSVCLSLCTLVLNSLYLNAVGYCIWQWKLDLIECKEPALSLPPTDQAAQSHECLCCWSRPQQVCTLQYILVQCHVTGVGALLLRWPSMFQNCVEVCQSLWGKLSSVCVPDEFRKWQTFPWKILRPVRVLPLPFCYQNYKVFIVYCFQTSVHLSSAMLINISKGLS